MMSHDETEHPDVDGGCQSSSFVYLESFRVLLAIFLNFYFLTWAFDSQCWVKETEILASPLWSPPLYIPTSPGFIMQLLDLQAQACEGCSVPGLSVCQLSVHRVRM